MTHINQGPTKIEDMAYYFGQLPSTDAADYLMESGDYLVRLACQSDNIEHMGFLLCVRWKEETIEFPILSKDGIHWSLDSKGKFSSIIDLIRHYHKSATGISASRAKLLNPISRTVWELTKEDIMKDKKLGAGSFGEVFKAKYRNPSTGVFYEAAVKTCCKEAAYGERKKFIQEALVMKGLKHPNIVKVIGLSQQTDPVMLVMEFVEGGSLDSYMEKMAASTKKPQYARIGPSEKIRFLHDASKGMEYLESKKCIHRDLAARNCLLDSVNMLKIGDFGMAKDSAYYKVEASTARFPLRWSSLESIQRLSFSQKNDVWAFGILAYEIYSEGQLPYEDLSNAEIEPFLESGKRIEPTPGTPVTIIKMMNKCWKEDPEERPSFEDIRVMIQGISRKEALTAFKHAVSEEEYQKTKHEELGEEAEESAATNSSNHSMGKNNKKAKKAKVTKHKK